MGDMPLLFRRVHEYLILFSGKFNFMCKESPKNIPWTSPIVYPARLSILACG
jgi:hypothetical protein